MKFDAERFAHIAIERTGKEAIPAGFRAKPLQESWPTPNCYLTDPRLERGNFFGWGGGDPVFEKSVRLDMAGILERAGEVLEMRCEEMGTLYALNVLENLDALDEDRTVWSTDSRGRRGGIKRWAFRKNVLADSSLFKLSKFPFSPLFTYTGKLDPNEEFVGRYERLGLRGLVFEKVWTDD